MIQEIVNFVRDLERSNPEIQPNCSHKIITL
jgi:hypothetical protein